MEDKRLDILEEVYLTTQIEKLIKKFEYKKVSYSTSVNDKIDIQVAMWKKLLNIIKEYCDLGGKKHKYVFDVDSVGEINDGSHTFNELYAHRTSLFAVICNSYRSIAWKSWEHNHAENFPMYEDYFIVGIDTPEGQFSYHCHKDWWDKFDVPELDEAPKFDGHEPDDVDRLFSLFEMLEEKNKDE